MKRLFLSTIALLALVGAAQADVVLDTKLSGTGDNVIFDSVNAAGHTALGHLNGQHLDVVRFGALDLSPTFDGAQNGNDIKITGTNDLEIQLFDPTNTFMIGTTEQVFSLSGDGTVKLFVSAVDANGVAEALKTFTLDPLKANAQNGFTLTAINGEVMTGLVIFDTNGTITDFEHYRIDAALIPQTPAVPELSSWVMLILGFAGIGSISMLRRRSDSAFRLA